MVEHVDSGFSPENLAEAEALWANLPVGNRSWTGLATHEKALVCHTVQRLRIAAEARGMEAAAKIAETAPIGGGTISSWINVNESPMQATRRHIATAIRAALNGGQYE